VTVSTGAGGGKVDFGNTVGLGSALDVGVAGNTGDVDFDGAVTLGGNDLTVVDAGTVTFNAGVTGTGGSLDVTSSTAVDIDNAAIALTGAGTVDFRGAGLVTSSGQNITTAGQDITFAALTPFATDTGAVTVSTGAGAGDVLFGNTLNGAQNLSLTAGTGDVTFTGAVGGGTVLGNLTVNSSGTLTANSTINAAKIDIRGNTAVNLLGNVTATAGNSFKSYGGNFNLPGGTTITTTNNSLLIANTGTVTVAGNLTATGSTVAFGSLDWASSKTTAVIGGQGTVTANTIILGGNNVGTALTAGNHGLTLNASASTVFFNLGLGGVDFSGYVLAGNFAGADVPLDHINTDGQLKIGNQVFGANNVDFTSLLTISAQQERIEKLLRAAASAEFFMKAPLWIDILMEEDEECDPDDEECLKRKRERQRSWLAPGNLRPSRFGVYMPTLLYEETEDGDLVIQLSSLR
jgi:hypothetical protein